MKRYPSLSVCMIAKNEEKNLPRVLSSVKGLAGEVIVVDTGSEDRTAAVAREAGAKVFHFDWCDDFSAARNESLRHATKDFVLWLDADDEVRREDHRRILNHLRTHPGQAVCLAVDADAKGKAAAMQIRVLPNRKGLRFKGRVHEQIWQSVQDHGVPVAICDATIVHLGYGEESLTLQKLARNRRLLEMDLAEDPDCAASHHFMARTLLGLGDPLGALGHLDKLADLGRDDPSLYVPDFFRHAMLDKARLLDNLGRKDEALSFALEYKEIFPDFIFLRHCGAGLYMERNEHRKAYEELLPLKNRSVGREVMLVDIKETERSIRRDLGISALFVGDFKVAEECFSAAAASEPSDATAYHFLALARETKGDIDGAIEACRQGLERTGQEGSLKKRLFLLYVRKEDFASALEVFETLNGFRGEPDVIAGRFLMSCKVLDARGMIRDYRVLQEKLSKDPVDFPLNLMEVKERLRTLGDQKPAQLFDEAVSFLLAKAS
jgi:tetratricopeptide (TPR) repeat protein